MQYYAPACMIHYLSDVFLSQFGQVINIIALSAKPNLETSLSVILSSAMTMKRYCDVVNISFNVYHFYRNQNWEKIYLGLQLWKTVFGDPRLRLIKPSPVFVI